MRMNIATALNSKYMRYAYVMLLSLLENQKASHDIHIYLLHNDLTDSDRQMLSGLAERFHQTITFIDVDAEAFPAVLPTTEDWTLEMYYRLMISELLPSDVSRLLYLDVDIIVNLPLDELFEMDFEGNCLCACPDMSSAGSFPDIRQELFDGFMSQGFTYFNSGVLLFDMEVFRSKYHFEDYMDLAKRLEYKIYAPDQDLLNYMHWRETKLLDEIRYDLFARAAYQNDVHYEEVKEQVAIVHFTGEKPWQGQYAHFDIEQLWWDYADKTPFAEELMREYVTASVNDPYLYDSIRRLSNANKALTAELKESVAVCQRLLASKLPPS